MSYYLNVRDEQPPHAVLGRLVVPYEAAIGKMERVAIEESIGWDDPRGSITIHTLPIHAFMENGYRILAFKMSRQAWDELKEKLE